MNRTDLQAYLSTNEACPGCGGDVLLVAADDGTTVVECPCSSTVVSAA